MTENQIHTSLLNQVRVRMFLSAWLLRSKEMFGKTLPIAEQSEQNSILSLWST